MIDYNDIVVRPATLSDAVAIAKYIWQTDKYIYPAVVNSPDAPAWIDFIADSLADADSIFFRDRVLVAETKGKVVGVCTYFRCGDAVHFALPVGEEISDGINFVESKYYFPLIENNLKRDGVYVSNLCVDKNFRNFGIGGRLIDSVFALFPDSDIIIDVIESNTAGRRLYAKKGFSVTKSFVGFSGKTDVSVSCLEMVHSK